MNIEISIVSQPIDRSCSLPGHIVSKAGAIAEFSGIVRGDENGQPIAGLEYEAYSPMAEKVIRRIVEEIGQLEHCLYVRVIHRIGKVPVGDAAIHILVAAVHRAEAFAMLTAFMDRLKQEVPIWKHSIPL